MKNKVMKNKVRKNKVRKNKVLPSSYTLRQFIEKLLIKGIRSLLQTNTYMCAFQLGVGIELLGEILDTSNQMGILGMSREHFTQAIQNISSFSAYSQYIVTPTQNSNQKKIDTVKKSLRQLRAANVITSADETSILNVMLRANVGSVTQSSPYDLYAAMRCGLLHNGIPSNDLYLATKMPNEVVQLSNGKWILDVEKLYKHFVDASNEVLGSRDPTVISRLGQVAFQVTSANALSQLASANSAVQVNQIANGQTSVPTQTQNIPNPNTTNTPRQNSSWPSFVTLSGHP